MAYSSKGMTDEQFDKGWDDSLNGRESSETRMIDAPADTASAVALRRRGYVNPQQVNTVIPGMDAGTVIDNDNIVRYENGKTVGGVVVKDGKSRTSYGGKVRVVDQSTGAVSWENPDGTAAAAPDSVRIAERGGLAEDPEVVQWRNQAVFNSRTLEQRKKMAGERNHLLAETAAQTLEQLNNGQGVVKTTNDGRRFRIVTFKNNGEDNPVARLNRMNTDMGRGGNMTSMSAAVEIDANGNAIGKPVIKYGRSDGGKGKATAWRDLDIGEVMNQWADTYADKTGQSQLEARRRAVDRFGGDSNLAGRNPAGWDIALTAQEKADEERRRFDAEQELNRQKVNNQDAQFYAELGFNKDKLDESIRQFDKSFGLDEKKYAEAVREFDASLGQKAKETADKLGVHKMEILANAGAKMAQGGSKRDLLSSLPREFVKSYIDAEIPELDAEGNPMLDEMTGKPMYRKPTTEEMRQRYAELEGLAKQAYGAASGDAYVNNLVALLDGNAAQPQSQAQQPTREEIQAELARRRAAKAQQEPAPLSQPVASLETPTPAQGQQDPRNDGATPSPSKELREKNTSQGAKAERESATSEELWGGDVVERFRRNHPEATDEDIRSGKFDHVLEKIGSALHGDGYKSRNVSLKDKESRLRAYEEQAARNKAEENNRLAHIAAMGEREQAIAQKAQDLFGDAWKQADDWAIEHHGDGVIFKDSYETARAKKFAELVKEKAKKDNIQLYNVYKLAQNVFGNYDIGNVFDTVFGAGAGTYFGRPKSGALARLEKKQS